MTDREDVFTSRALLTLTADGGLLVTDSGLLGGPDSPSPVYTAQGSWRCYAMQPEALDIEAVAVNLALPGRDGLPGFGRIDYRLTSSTAGATLTGSAELRRFDSSDLEGAEPMTDPGDLVDRLHIEAVKLTAPQHLDPPNE